MRLPAPLSDMVDQRLDDLSIGELDLLKETTDGLIEHMEQLKAAQANRREQR